METPIPKQQDDKWININKIIWFAIPAVAFLIMGIMLGVYISGKNIEQTLKENNNLKPCLDESGNVWLKEDKRINGLNLSQDVESKDYNQN